MSRFSRNLIRVGILASAAPFLLSAQGMRTNFDSRLLASHNRERIAMGLAPMEWDQRLASDAQVWADKLASSGEFYHSPDQPGKPLEGENLWSGTRGAYTPEDMVGLWLAEKRYFRPGRFPQNSTTGNVLDVAHYTQLIWHNTYRVGCAVARGEKDDVLVCRYSTYGNIIGDNPLKGDNLAAVVQKPATQTKQMPAPFSPAAGSGFPASTTNLQALAAPGPYDFRASPLSLGFTNAAAVSAPSVLENIDFGAFAPDPLAGKGFDRKLFAAPSIAPGSIAIGPFDPDPVK